jgi:hypothetical protein
VFVGGFCKPLKTSSRRGDIHGEAFADWFAHVESFKQGQFMAMTQNELSPVLHDFFTRSRRLLRPSTLLEGLPCRVNGPINVRLLTSGHFTEPAAINGRMTGEGLAIGGGYSLPINEQAAIKVKGQGLCVPIRRGEGGVCHGEIQKEDLQARLKNQGLVFWAAEISCSRWRSARAIR